MNDLKPKSIALQTESMVAKLLLMIVSAVFISPAQAKLKPAYAVHEGLALQNSFIKSKISIDGSGPEYLQLKRVAVDKNRDTQLPAAFVDGVALSLEAYADYESVAQLMKLEGLVPKREFLKIGIDPKSGEDIISNKFTKITLSFCRDNRVTYGSADTVRIAFQAQLDESDFLNKEDYQKLNKTNSNYVEMRVIWRYWADAAYEKVPLIRSVMGYPAISANIDLNVTGNNKSVVLKNQKNNEVLLEAGFSSKIDHLNAHFSDLPSMVIVPGNERFSPGAKGLQRKNLITWLDGYGTPRNSLQPFNPKTDKFEPKGELANLLSSIGFTTKNAKWSLLNSYTGVFENRSLDLKVHN